MQKLLELTVFMVFIPAISGLTLDDLYPFGSQNGDTAMEKNDDGSSDDIPILTLFPFFNHQHPKLIVNTNGVISFLQTVRTFTPNPFPIANDARMIAPFWADVDTTRGGTVWYRETTDKILLDRATDEVRAYFPTFFRFRASWIFIATWDNVAFYGCSSEGCLKKNTFQAVLITNGQHSFAIYNYEDIQWTTGTASSGNSSNGLGGTPAQVGFNAGDGIVYFTVNASRSPDIVNVDEYSNVHIPGKFAFRIDASDISDGGCNTKGFLTINPRYGPMLGGQYVVITGPCIEQNSTISVLNFESPKKCEMKSEFSFACITPMFTYTGDVLFLISIESNGVTKIYKGLYTILNPADSKHRVFRHDNQEWALGNHYISWDPDAAELQADNNVDIHVFSLKEGNSRSLTWQKEVLRQGVRRELQSTDVFLQTSGHALALRVTASSPRTDQYERGIWSDIFPLALPPNEARPSCENWLTAEAQMLPLPSDNAQPCPCTLQQALLDVVRFQPDPDCNLFNRISQFSRTGNCLHRRDATHCIRMTALGQNVDNLCCYDQGNNLIDSRVKEGGSLQRYHYLGGSQILPYLHNFYFDVMPFLHCCRYSQNVYSVGEGNSIVGNICPDFFNHRKFSSCANYVPPRPARTAGDPHITTLDGYSYTFNGVGEFVYLNTEDESFQSHIRFEQFRKENGELVSASVCTAFASQHFNTSGIIEVRLNSIRTADVLMNGELVDFDDASVHQFPGVFVMQMSANQSNVNTTRKELIVSFTEIGIAFKVIASDKVLNILPVVGNNSLAGSLRGLLGDFDENQSNELRTPSGEILSENSTSEEIYDRFGVLWRITENISLFTYEPGKSYNDYQQLTFRPTFSLATNLSSEVEELCGTDQECAFDYVVTDSAEFAAETLIITEIYNTSVGATYEIKHCVDLPSVPGGVWNATNTKEGAIATFSCYPGYEIEGTSNIVTCTNGTWGNFGNFSCFLIGTSTSSTNPPTTSTQEETTTNQPITSTTEVASTTTTSSPSTSTSTTTSRTTTKEASTTKQPISTTEEQPTTVVSTTSTTEEGSWTTTSTSSFTTTTDEATTTKEKSAVIPTTSEEALTTTTGTTSTEEASTTTTTGTTSTEEASTTTGTTSTEEASTTTTTGTTSAQSSTTQEASMTTEIQSSTTANLHKTIQLLDEEFQKILPYLIGSVIMILFLSVLIGFLIVRRRSKKNN